MIFLRLQYFGGRGARFGISEKDNKYGSQFHSVGEYGNVKFVTNSLKNNESLMETATPGRIYAQVGGKDIVRIVMFDNNNMRAKKIEYDKRTKEWHVHYGYEHNEDNATHWAEMSQNDKDLLEKILKVWENMKK